MSARWRSGRGDVPYTIGMVDRTARERLAYELRQLASGLITNDEFDEEAFWEYRHRKDDRALGELATFGWLHYGDLSNYRLRGSRALTPEERKSIARAVLFLKTDQEYVHGDCVTNATILGEPGMRSCLVAIGGVIPVGFLLGITVGNLGFGLLIAPFLVAVLFYVFSAVLGYRAHRRWRGSMIPGTFWPFLNERAAMEEFRFWPFEGRQGYDKAIAEPPFLCGAR